MKEKIVSFILAIWILLTPLYMLSGLKPTYDFLYQRTHQYEVESLEKEEIDQATQGIISYLHARRENLYISIQGKSLFQAQEIYHMWEVKRIFLFMRNLLLLLSAVLVFYFVKYRNPKPLKTQVFGFLAIVGFSALAALFFDKAFTWMHKLIFNNDYWMFSLSSPLIAILEENFFLYFFMGSLGISCIISFLLWVVGRHYDQSLHR